jgi:cytosine/adenosine deaminase-related metal-dependent hydrolase
MSILLKNATYIDWDTLAFTDGDILVEEGLQGGLHFIGEDAKLPGRPGTTIDCVGKLVTKSFAIGHHHVYSALARGMPPPDRKPVNFREILQTIWWTLDKCLDKEMIRYSALVTAMAAAKAGSTFVIDHHASPGCIGGSLDIIAEAFDEVGVSHLLCYEVTDRDGRDKALMGLRETERYLEKRQGLVGMHASFTVGDASLEAAAGLIQQFSTGAHVHLAEDLYDQEHCLHHYGKRVMERWHEAGILNASATILVHGLHLDDREREIFRGNPCWLAQNMESNLKNKVGFFNGDRLGERIMLGTDGMHSDMMQSVRMAFFAGQKFDKIDFAEAYHRLRNVHRYLSTNRFVGDSDNCLVVMDYDNHTEINQDNFIAHLLFGMQSGHVTDVIANGRLIVSNRDVVLVDQEKILHEARDVSRRLWQRMKA